MSASHTDLPALDPVLEGVYRRGYSLRRQRMVRRLAAGALSFQLLVALPYAVQQGDDAGGRNVRVVAPATQEEPATTTTEVPAAVAEETASTTVVAAVAPTTSTTALVCRNSFDERCGPFRWEQDPGPNAPLSVEVRFEPANPVAGQEVRFFVTVRDPDADQFSFDCDIYGDEPVVGQGTCASSQSFGPDDGVTPQWCNKGKHGPWTLPPHRGGQAEWGNPPGSGIAHTYEQPGTYTAKFERGSRSIHCYFDEDPYGSGGSASVQLTVAPAPTTTTTAG